MLYYLAMLSVISLDIAIDFIVFSYIIFVSIFCKRKLLEWVILVRTRTRTRNL